MKWRRRRVFEEVAYLLLNGELPNGKQLVEFTQQIASERALPVGDRNAPASPEQDSSHGHVRTGVSMLSAFDKDLNDTRTTRTSVNQSPDCASFHPDHSTAGASHTGRAYSRKD